MLNCTVVCVLDKADCCVLYRCLISECSILGTLLCKKGTAIAELLS